MILEKLARYNDNPFGTTAEALSFINEGSMRLISVVSTFKMLRRSKKRCTREAAETMQEGDPSLIKSYDRDTIGQA